jgi:2-polyprenyl-3-methyl-5-hydroxy-6-metoxy-1,4-benzoquinol methylase
VEGLAVTPAASPCRFCSAPLSVVFADLGMSPLANALVAPEDANAMERFYPLRAFVCERCFLVQLEEFESPEAIFGDYSYFSSYSTSWLAHSERYAAHAVERFGLDASSRVVELASNDGYLLRYFRDRGIPVLGVEPAANVARIAQEKGIETRVAFFGTELARSLAAEAPADLIVGNNVLAHVPDLNDFVAGMEVLLAPDGQITMELPHLMRLVEESQWDTIYHEHFSYFSLTTAAAVFAAHGLRVFDVEELPTHGGSLRIYACHADDGRTDGPAVAELLERERRAGYGSIELYTGFRDRVVADKRRILEFLIAVKGSGRRIVGYGAPAKGNTLLNFCGVRTDFLDYTCDLNPHKQGHLLPGTHIPIRSPDVLADDRPEVVLVLPWNLLDEIVEQLSFIREWGGRFAARTPELTLVP